MLKVILVLIGIAMVWMSATDRLTEFWEAISKGMQSTNQSTSTVT